MGTHLDDLQSSAKISNRSLIYSWENRLLTERSKREEFFRPVRFTRSAHPPVPREGCGNARWRWFVTVAHVASRDVSPNYTASWVNCLKWKSPYRIARSMLHHHLFVKINVFTNQFQVLLRLKQTEMKLLKYLWYYLILLQWINVCDSKGQFRVISK